MSKMLDVTLWALSVWGWYAFSRVGICRFLVLEHSAKIKPKTPICEMRSNA